MAWSYRFVWTLPLLCGKLPYDYDRCSSPSDRICSGGAIGALRARTQPLPAPISTRHIPKVEFSLTQSKQRRVTFSTRHTFALCVFAFFSTRSTHNQEDPVRRYARVGGEAIPLDNGKRSVHLYWLSLPPERIRADCRSVH